MNRVIVIEDHTVMRETIKSLVEQVDTCIVVAEAKDGSEAIRIIEETPADLILLDLSLPQVSGLEVLEKVRPQTSAKILVVTMFNETEVIKKAFALGANCAFEKDRGLAAFKKVVAETLEGTCPEIEATRV